MKRQKQKYITERKCIQITSSAAYDSEGDDFKTRLYVLCEDGTMWELIPTTSPTWKQLPSIPDLVEWHFTEC